MKEQKRKGYRANREYCYIVSKVYKSLAKIVLRDRAMMTDDIIDWPQLGKSSSSSFRSLHVEFLQDYMAFLATSRKTLYFHVQSQGIIGYSSKNCLDPSC